MRIQQSASGALGICAVIALSGGCWLGECEGGDDDGPTCGDGRAEVGEQCDLQDLKGETCESLYPELPVRPGSSLSCAQDCTFNHTDCSACGNGRTENGEECDPPDGQVSCLELGYGFGIATCTEACLLDRSECGSCPEGQAFCRGTCVDVFTDAAHCGDCNTRCANTELCLAGRCVARYAPWSPLGDCLGNETSEVRAHAFTAWDGKPTLSVVATVPGGRSVSTRYWAAGSWSHLVYAPSGAATEIADVVAMAVDQGDLYVGWVEGLASSPRLVHVTRWEGLGGGWYEPGWPGAPLGVGEPLFLDLAVSGGWAELVASLDVGGDVAVDSWRWSALGWTQRPGPGGGGALTEHGAGRPSLLLADRPWVALSETSSSTGEVTHRILGHDPLQGEWLPLGGALDETPTAGLDEDSALTMDAEGRLVVAWSEAAADASGLPDVYVKRWEPSEDAWVLMGGGLADAVHGAVEPSLAWVGGRLFVAYVATAAGARHVKVAAYDEGTGWWMPVGGELNRDPLQPARRPAIMGIGGQPFVVHREGPDGAQRACVSTFP